MNIRDLKNRLQRVDVEVRKTVRESRAYWGEIGVDEVHDTILTTPSSIIPGKRNRVYTGSMFNDVAYRRRDKGSAVFLDIGWFQAEDYYKTQERGGMSRGLMVGDRYIKPMNALKNATDAILREMDLQEIAREGVRRAL